MLTNSVVIPQESTVAVQVRIPTILRPDAGNQSVVEAEGDTVGAVFSDLVARFPNLSSKVITEDGELHKFVNVYLNDDDVRYLDKLDTKVTSADTISILPAVAGG